MTAVYFDASALVKLIKQEPGSSEAAATWALADQAHGSRLATIEVRAAIAAARRNRAIPAHALPQALRTEERVRAGLLAIELTDAIEVRARVLVERHDLSGADAVHLASALALEDPDLVLATWDRRLHAAAQAEGLRVAPATI